MAYRARVALFDNGALEALHAATLKVLSESGVEVRHERTLDLLRSAGAKVEGSRVRIEADLVEWAIKAAPKTWRLSSRGQSGEVVLEDGRTYWGTGPDNMYVTDLDSGERRRARIADVEGIAALCDRLPHIDWIMSMGLPEDVDSDAIDLYQFAAMCAGTRKPIIASTPFAGTHLRAMREMAAMAGEPSSFAVLTMSSPPLMHDETTIERQLVCAELDIPMVLAPAPTCGTGTPMSLTANMVVCNAEALSCLVYHQLSKPGAPFVYGAGPGIMNLHTAVDLYGSPDCFLGYQGSVELGRYYGLPTWSYSTVTDAKTFDEQLALEYGVTTFLGSLSGATLLHDVGYMESGLQSSYESVVLADEVIAYAKGFMRELEVDAQALQVEAIVQAGPGGNHLASKHTRRHYRDFWTPSLLDQNVYERWKAGGGLTLKERVHQRALEVVEHRRDDALDGAVRERLYDFAKRWVERT